MREGGKDVDVVGIVPVSLSLIRRSCDPLVQVLGDFVLCLTDLILPDCLSNCGAPSDARVQNLKT